MDSRFLGKLLPSRALNCWVHRADTSSSKIEQCQGLSEEGLDLQRTGQFAHVRVFLGTSQVRSQNLRDCLLSEGFLVGNHGITIACMHLVSEASFSRSEGNSSRKTSELEGMHVDRVTKSSAEICP